MLLYIFINNILPAFIIVGFGALADRHLALDVRTPSRLTLYILTPCLIFSSLVKSNLAGEDITQIFVYLILITMAIGVVSWTAARLLSLDRVRQNTLLLSTMFLNAGNFGLPIVLFAYGQAGMDRGLVFYTGSALLVNTLGAYFASRGRASARQSLVNILRLPAAYAIVLAFLLRGLHITPPEFLLKPISLAGSAAIPILLLVLGMQLSRTRLRGNLPLVSLAVFIKLVVAAALAFAIAYLLGLQGLTRQVCIFESSTPVAVSVIMMSIEFNADPEFVTSAVFLSTLLSSLTLTVVLSLLA